MFLIFHDLVDHLLHIFHVSPKLVTHVHTLFKWKAMLPYIKHMEIKQTPVGIALRGRILKDLNTESNKNIGPTDIAR